MGLIPEIELEKIRYQIGVIIKSWSNVERIIEDDYTAYEVNGDIFVYLFSDTVLVPISEAIDGINFDPYTKVHISSHDVVPLSNIYGITLSLQDYHFTEIMPFLQNAYQRTILHHLDQ